MVFEGGDKMYGLCLMFRGRKMKLIEAIEYGGGEGKNMVVG